MGIQNDIESILNENKAKILLRAKKLKKWPTYAAVERIRSEYSRLEMEYDGSLSSYDFLEDEREGFILDFIAYEKEEGRMIDLSRIGIGETVVFDRYWGLVRMPTLRRGEKNIPMTSDLGSLTKREGEQDYIIYHDLLIDKIENYLAKA
jgi:hypothetical protein